MSLDIQREHIEARFGPIPAQLCFEDVKTGMHFKRPGFHALVEYCRRHPAPDGGLICVAALDRFATPVDAASREEALFWRCLLEEFGWRVVEAEGRSDLLNELGSMIGGMIDANPGAFLEERELIERAQARARAHLGRR